MIKKIVTYIPSIVIPLITNIIFLYLNSTYLTKESFGEYSIYINTINLLYNFSISFLQISALRFYYDKKIKNQNVSFVSTYVFSNIFITTLVYFGAILFNSVTNNEINMLLVSISVIINGLYNFYLNIFRLENKSGKYTVARIIPNLLSLIMYSLFILVSVNITSIHPIIALYGSYAFIVFFETINRRKDIKISKFSFNIVKESASYGIPMIGVSVASSLLASSDSFIILHYLGTESVGMYSLGYRISDTLFTNLSMIVLLVMYPVLIRYFDEGELEKSEYIIRKMINFNNWILVPISLWLYINIDSILLNFFPQYVEAEYIVRLSILAGLFHSVSMYTCKGLELAKDTNKIFWSLSIATVINIIVNILFIPLYGVSAAVYGSIVAYFFYNILLIFFSKKYIAIKIDYLFFVKILIVSIFVSLFSLYIKGALVQSPFNILINIMVCGSLYILISHKIKIISEFKYIE